MGHANDAARSRKQGSSSPNAAPGDGAQKTEPAALTGGLLDPSTGRRYGRSEFQGDQKGLEPRPEKLREGIKQRASGPDALDQEGEARAVPPSGPGQAGLDASQRPA